MSLVLAGLGLLSVWWRLPETVNIGLAIFSLGLVGLDYLGHRRSLRRTEFQRRESESFDDVVEALSANPRFSPGIFANGTVLFDSHITRLLQDGKIAARLGQARFRPPVELRALGQRFLDEARQRSTLFPGPMLGLATDLGLRDEDVVPSVDLQPATYFEHVQTDLLATVDVLQDGITRSDLGRRLFLDRHHVPRDFGGSWLFNGIGTSTLAFTSDGKLMTVAQSDRNLNSPGLLAPAGSGALEPDDALAAHRLDQVTLRGAQRELCEETGVRQDEIETGLALGFGRWLEMAARPEFYAVTFLSVDSHELNRRPIPRHDARFVRHRRFDRLPDSLSDWLSTPLDQLLPPDARGALSVPLAAALWLLWNKVHEGGAMVTELTNRGVLRTSGLDG